MDNNKNFQWKLRVGSPRELHWELQHSLKNSGYEVEQISQPLELGQTPIEGHATFSEETKGIKTTTISRLGLLLIGILLCFTIILLPLGLYLVRLSKYQLTQEIVIDLEGETYRASARSEDPYKAQSEVTDIVSNARITLQGQIYRQHSDKDRDASDIEAQSFEGEFGEIKRRIDKLVPQIELPKTV